MPMGIRSSDPSTTGTAVRKSVEVLERSSASWNFFASGAIRPQAEKQAMKASVASARFQPGDWRNERLADGVMQATLSPDSGATTDQFCSGSRKGGNGATAHRGGPDEQIEPVLDRGLAGLEQRLDGRIRQELDHQREAIAVGDVRQDRAHETDGLRDVVVRQRLA